jgi:serine/threonine protein kinase
MSERSDPVNTVSESEGQPAIVGERPSHVGRYRVERLLGEGGFGRVYLAHDEQLRRPMAVKVPHAHLTRRPEDAAAYLAEARTAAGLDHPHVVPVYDVGSTADHPCFIVAKFIAGRTSPGGSKQGGRLLGRQGSWLQPSQRPRTGPTEKGV